MSCRRLLEDDPPDEDEDEEDAPDDEEVEYFVEAEEVDSVRTSVPNPLQSPQSWSSAPSTFVVVSEDFSAPHISHCGMDVGSGPPPKKEPTTGVDPTTSERPPGRPHVRSDHAPQNRWSAVT